MPAPKHGAKAAAPSVLESAADAEEMSGRAFAVAAEAFAASAMSHEEFETICAERTVQAEVELHDALLERLRLRGLVHRYRERPVTLDEIVSRQEQELKEIEAEIQRLIAENVHMALDKSGCPVNNPLSEGVEKTSSTPVTRRAGLKSAFEELHDEVAFLRHRVAQLKRQRRSILLEENHLAGRRAEAQQVVRQLRCQEQRLEEGVRRKAASEALLRDVEHRLTQSEQDVRNEQETIRNLNQEVVELRESCYVPARQRRDRDFLLKMLDQGGGIRSKSRRHLCSLDTCIQMYDRVSELAPNLLALTSRVRSDMEARVARYLHLEASHLRALRHVSSAVTSDL